MEFHRVLTIQRLHQNIWMKPNLLSPRRERSLSMMEPSSTINIRSNVNSRSFHSNLFHFNNSDVNYSSTSFKWKETGDYWGVPRFFSLLIGALRSHHRSLNDSWEMRRSWGGRDSPTNNQRCQAESRQHSRSWWGFWIKCLVCLLFDRFQGSFQWTCSEQLGEPSGKDRKFRGKQADKANESKHSWWEQ